MILSKEQTGQSRDSIIDGIKYILISLVVFGHVKQFTVFDHNSISVSVVGYTIHSIYLFHMPLFIIISGYFSRQKDNRSFKESMLKLIRVYLFFQLLWILIDILNGQSITWERFFYPSFTLWYLHCLVIWRCILQYIPVHVLNNFYLVIGISLLVSMLGGFIPVSNFLALQRTMTFMPLFFLGFYAKQNGWLEKVYHLKWYIYLLTAVLFVIGNKVSYDVWGRSPYDTPLDMIRRLVFLSSSIVISIAFIKVLPSKITLFANEGQDVLFYYLYHSIILYLFALFLKYIGVIADGFVLFTIFFVTMVTLYYLRRIAILHFPLM